MHIPDGFFSVPVSIATSVMSLAGLGLSVFKVNRDKTNTIGIEKQIPMVGVVAAFIFAAQMLNFPVLGGTSGHFLGAVLAALLLGPWWSCIIMSVVLIIQCFGFGDGGLSALGANIFNMGVIGGIVCYYIFNLLNNLFKNNKKLFILPTFIVSWLSVVLASFFCSLELVISNTSPLQVVMPAMLGVHCVIGVGEAIITSAVITLVMAFKRDLVFSLKTN